MYKIIEELKAQLVNEVRVNEPLAKHTTYRVGGECSAMVFPSTIEELTKVIQIATSNNIKYKVVGKGSNLLFSDSFYDGIIVKTDKLNHLEINDLTLIVGAGYSMPKLSLHTAKLGYTGLEFASGIPASVGGCIYMNAGAYHEEMKDVVTRVHILLPNGTLKWFSNEEMEFTYRHSILHQHKEWIVVEVEMQLQVGDALESIELINERKKRRMASQPLDLPSAGSVFKNPHPYYSWQVIDECGLRGQRVGGAMVSDKHTNFIVNVDHATATDIHELIQYVQKVVKEKKGIELYTEQEYVNWD